MTKKCVFMSFQQEIGVNCVYSYSKFLIRVQLCKNVGSHIFPLSICSQN